MASAVPPHTQSITLSRPLPLDGGQVLSPVTIAYETYGELAADKSNAILVCHALTGDQYVASTHPITGKPGWWERMVGPGKPIDTDRFFVICSNVIGSCMGSTGPASLAPDGQPYGMRFPVITIRDMVRAQVWMLQEMGITTLHAAVGGSMGGMQVLSLAANFPDVAERVLAIATTARHSAQNIAFHEVGRQSIMADPNWADGNYYGTGKSPDKGLSVARMAAHITYLSEAGLTGKFGRRLQNREEKSFGFDADFQIESYLRYQGLAFTDRFDANSYLYITYLSEAGLTGKFGRRLQNREEKSFGFDADFQIESYLRYQGLAFTDRFDANSYLYITRATDYFDIAEEHGGKLADAFAGSKAKFCIVSFDTDWLYPTANSRSVVHALNAAGAPVSFVELSAPYGHDSFLLDVLPLDRVVAGFVNR